MTKVWLQQQWDTLIPALEVLGVDQEAEIERLCVAEIAYWRDERKMSLSSMRVPMTDTRNRLKKIRLTPANSWINPKTGKPEHIARKYMNFSEEEWLEMSTPTEEDVQERQENQQYLENPDVIVAKAEQLLASGHWYDLVVAIALVSGRRLTEVLKTARFFPCSLYTVTFDGQLKRRDFGIKPYEIPILVPAEKLLAAWRKLRGLIDTVDLDNEQVAQRYSRDATEAANRHFTGLIPRQKAKDNLTTKAFRAVYAHIAILWFCPFRPDDRTATSDRTYANAILGHWQAKDDKTRRHFLATEHYFDYVMSLDGRPDGRRGIRLEEPGIEVLSIFKQKAEASMSTDELTTQEEVQGKQQVLETQRRKSRGTLTTRPGTFNIVHKLMQNRGFQKHDEIVVDLLEHDSVAHQMNALLAPLAPELHTGEDRPLETLQALITAYRAGGAGPQAPGMAELVAQVDKPDPLKYLSGLVERDKKFWQGVENRTSKVDVSSASMEDLRHKIKTKEAATERFRRAVDAVMRHNEETEDYLHRWYINAAMVRKLVGGQNELVQAYLRSRQDEIAAHHDKYRLTSKANEKGQLSIENDVIVS